MSNKRIAVIIVHGMGEQKPMTTLRGFASSLLDYEKHALQLEEEVDRWVKPNVLSTTFSSKKITARHNKSRSAVEFFEYYWAHNMRDNNISHIQQWYFGLMLKTNVPNRLRIFWIISWILLFIILALILGIVHPSFYSHLTDETPSIFSGLSINKLISIISIIGTFALTWIQKKLIGSFGDAARYFNITPENIKERDRIISDGLNLIKSLDPKEYSRIIVVGHSLGSAIAYDILNILWFDKYQNITFDDDKKNKIFIAAINEIAAFQKMKNLDLENKKKLQNAQSELFKLIRKAKEPWLVSDFITLGSPLTYGPFLMAETTYDFQNRIADREINICPPNPEKGTHSLYFLENEKDNPVIHLGGMFASIRWTNLYYPGDIIGGKINTLLGQGIINHKCRTKGLLQHLPTSHTRYWASRVKESSIENSPEYNSIQHLFEAINFPNEPHPDHTQKSTELSIKKD